MGGNPKGDSSLAPAGTTTTSSNTNDGAGNPITSTPGSGGHRGLDVQVLGGDIIIDNASLNVNLDAATGDNVAIKDSTGTNALSISAGGAAKVDGSAVTQPVSGTVAATQSGTWNINNVSGTVSLPTGASTAAKQPALGTAGTASADVITVQGIASMTALKTDSSATTQPISGSVTATQATGSNLHVVVDTAPSTAVTNAGTFVVQAAQSGTWTVQPGNTANTTAWKVDGSAVTQPVSIASVPSHAVTNAGTFAVQAACAGDVASGSSDSGNPIKVGGLAKTSNPTAVTDGQRVNALFDKLGKQVAVGAIRDLKGVTQTSVSNTTAETTIITAVASTFMDLYGLILANTGATTTKVTIKDATAGTTRAIIEVPTLETRGFMLSVDSAVPQAVVNNNWTVTCASATTALEVTAFWVKNI